MNWRAERTVLAAVYVVALLSFAACVEDSPSSEVDASTSTGGSSPSTIEFTAPPTSPSPYSTTPISFTTNVGWSYRAEPDLGLPTLTASKDITQSPPGLARLVFSFDPAGNTEVAVSADTPGRDAPPVSLEMDAVVYTLNTSTADAFTSSSSGPPTGGCTVSEVTREFDPTVVGAAVFVCYPALAADGGGQGTIEASEEAVDAVVSELQASEAPIIVTRPYGTGRTRGGAGGCEIYFLPDASTALGEALREGEC